VPGADPTPDAVFEVEVETAAVVDPSGEPLPSRFRLGRRSIAVVEILDRWPGTDHAYVKLRGSDGATYILRHTRPNGPWQLVLFQRTGTMVQAGPA
jgi:hypothetical protein